MGHPVNPVSFRLGIARGWNFTSSSLENKHQYFFFNAHSSNVLNFFKRLFNTKVVQKLGFIFSHISVFSAFKKHHYLIFFYDGAFEANGKFFYDLLQKKIFQKTLFLKRALLLKEILLKKARKLFRNNFLASKNLAYNILLFKQVKILTLKKKILELILDVLHAKITKFFFRKTIKKIFFFLSPEEFKESSSIFYFFLSDHLRLLVTKCFSKDFFFKLKKSLEKKISKINLFMTENILKKLKKRFFFSKLKIRLNFLGFVTKMLMVSENLKYRKILFFKFFIKFIRSFLFTAFFRVFLHKFKKILFPTNFKQVTFTFKSISKAAITASVIAKYICVRLAQKYSMKAIVRPIIKDLVSNRYVSGFKISCCGRFTKKEIATFFWKKMKKVSLSQATSRVDYSFKEVILKYSVCGIKVWLQTNPSFPLKQFTWYSSFDNLDISTKKKKLKIFKKQNLRNLKKPTSILKKTKFKKFKKNGSFSKKNKI